MYALFQSIKKFSTLLYFPETMSPTGTVGRYQQNIKNIFEPHVL